MQAANPTEPPTVTLMLVTLWAFLETSLRFHGWLYGQPAFWAAAATDVRIG